ncbi:aldo/keto reductase [Blautia producta]|uniref:aldo/keto reductase n=1 Tax=Blautia producta TaxID=33035 RepID=UPI001D04DFC7|nr:aldo/keto reductase [Blautia producta]MCB6784103.1 aldo/keto reductase [Blautia producta]
MVNAVKSAIRAGYHNINTALTYNNEKGIRKGVYQAMEKYGVKREEVFIRTKLWKNYRSYDLTMKIV